MPGSPRAKLPLTSLIDVIFLLLLFFMLTSTFSRFGEIPVTIGGTGASIAPTDAPPVLVRIDAQGASLNGTSLDVADLSTQIADLSTNTPRVIVTATREATAQKLAETLHALRAIAGAQIVVVQ